jgi:hypothetical protein
LVPPSVPDDQFSYTLLADAQAIDAAGNVYVAGSWAGGNLQFGAPAAATLPGSTSDQPRFGFVAKYAPDGGLIWTKTFEPHLSGYPGIVTVSAIAVDGQGGLYVTGSYANEVDFDPGPGESVLDNMASMYLLRMTGDGDLSWVNNMGEFQSEEDVSSFLTNTPTGLAVDGAGQVYVTGRFAGATVDFDPGPGVTQLAAGSFWESPFVVQYHADGSLGWAKAFTGMPGSNSVIASGGPIAVVPGGGVVVAGYFRGSFDFDPGPGTAVRSAVYSGTSSYVDALFVARLDAAGNLSWVDSLVQPPGVAESLDMVDGLAVDRAGNVYIAGNVAGKLDFDPGPGTTLVDASPVNDRTYLVKYGPGGGLLWVRDFPESQGIGLTLDDQDRPILAGTFTGFVPLAPGLADILGGRSPDNPLLVRIDPATGRATASRAVTSAVPTIVSLARGPSGVLSVLGSYHGPITLGTTALPAISSTRPGKEGIGSVFVALFDPIADPPPTASFQLSPGSDNGDSDHDLQTSAPSLTFNVTGVPAGRRVELYWSSPGGGSTPGLAPVAIRDGSGPITDAAPPAAGVEYEVSYWVRVVDPVRGASPIAGPITVHRDTRGPGQPSIPFEFLSFPGMPARITPGSTLTGFGGESGGMAQLLDSAGNILAAGTTFVTNVPGAGPLVQYRITLPAWLIGPQTLSVRVLDRFGNPGEPTQPSTVLIADPPAGGPGQTPGGATPLPVAEPPHLISAVIVKKKGKQMIVLTFDRDLAPGSARIKANYALRGAGRDRRYNTRDDAKLKVKSAVHDAARRTVTLTPSKAVARNLPFRLTIRGLLGADGIPLEGTLEANLGPMPKG